MKIYTLPSLNPKKNNKNKRTFFFPTPFRIPEVLFLVLTPPLQTDDVALAIAKVGAGLLWKQK